MTMGDPAGVCPSITWQAYEHARQTGGRPFYVIAPPDVLARAPIRKFFYLFTCEYCFSHYVTVFALWMTGFHFLLPDWRGYVLGGFALVWIANVYMSLFGRLRLDIREERLEIEISQYEKQTLVRPATRAGWSQDDKP